MYSKFSSMGRSMIEMLGVLAVIGVLSIGALVGFQYALNKHKANETLNDIQLWALQAVEAEQAYTIGQTIPTDDIGYTSSQGYNIAAVAAGDNLFAVELMNVPQKVCALLLKMAQNEYTIELTTAEMGSGMLFAGNTDECKDKPTLYFYFNTNLKKPTEVCLPGCASGESCCNNACYPTQGLCGDLCACPTGTECKGDGLCCLPESEACNGTCCPVTQVCTNAGCACPEGAILNEEEQCVCPADKPYYFKKEDGGPICCAAGNIAFDGQCHSLTCERGTTNKWNWYCYIDGFPCGQSCYSDGSDCYYRNCKTCPVDSERYFWRNGWVCVPNQYPTCFHAYASGQLSCAREKGGEVCCLANSKGECYQGTCNKDKCPIVNELTVQLTNDGRCLYSNGVRCWAVDSTNGLPSLWQCYNSQLSLCTESKISTNDLPGTVLSEACSNICLSVGGTYNAETGFCDRENIDVACQPNGNCYRNVNGKYKQCGSQCSVDDCRYGICYPDKCPNGTTYNTTTLKCIDNIDSSITCSYNVTYGIECYQNEQKCGDSCSGFGTGNIVCSHNYTEACAPQSERDPTKKSCPYGSSVTTTCACPTFIKEDGYYGIPSTAEEAEKFVSVGTLCCPEGQRVVNGACSVL